MSVAEIILIGPFFMILSGIIADWLRPLELVLTQKTADGARVVLGMALAGLVVWCLTNAPIVSASLP